MSIFFHFCTTLYPVGLIILWCSCRFGVVPLLYCHCKTNAARKESGLPCSWKLHCFFLIIPLETCILWKMGWCIDLVVIWEKNRFDCRVTYLPGWNWRLACYIFGWNVKKVGVSYVIGWASVHAHVFSLPWGAVEKDPTRTKQVSSGTRSNLTIVTWNSVLSNLPYWEFTLSKQGNLAFMEICSSASRVLPIPKLAISI